MKKAFDQTVRDLKREVNKKVLKVPGIEQKVLDATSNEPWGPHGSHLADIAQATRNYHEYQMIMAVLWKRINDTGKNWRHVYKALTVLEYLVAHGSERVIDEIKEHAYQISTLSDFQYIDSSGRDQGSNVRKKSQSIVTLVNDKERIQEARQKALVNRDKFRNTTSTGGMYRPSGGYGDRYDDDRYGGRDDDRNGYGREREYGYRDDDRSSRGGDSYSRDGDRYGRDSEERYGRDGYRDDDYRGRSRSNDDYQSGSRSRSSDRYRERAFDDDGRYSSRSSDARAEDHSQDERRLERKFSEQNIGAPPSYEEAVSDARSPVHDERDGDTPVEPIAKASSPPGSTIQSPVTSGSGTTPAPANQETNAFDEFDPRGSVSASPPPASGGEMDLLGSLSDSFSTNSLALMPVTSATTTSEADVPIDSGSGATFVALSSASTVLNQPTEDPFGDSPFKAIPSADNIPPQQPQNFASTSNFQPTALSQSSEPVQTAPVQMQTASGFDFGDTFQGLSFAPSDATNVQVPSTSSQFLPSEPSPGHQSIDILADILPPTGSTAQASPFLALPAPTGPPSQPSVPGNFPTQSGYGAPVASQGGYNVPTGPSQPNVPGSFPAQSGYGTPVASQGAFNAPSGPSQPSVPGNFPPQSGYGAPVASHGAFNAPSGPSQPSVPGNFPYGAPVASQGAFNAPSGPAPQQNSNFLGNFYQQTGPSTAPTASQAASLPASTGLPAKPQPSKDKFETKSTVWADTLSRGLVNLNISGPKTNPLADIGIDFESINRKEKREKPVPQTAVTSTINMGKAMGSGSGMGRAGASALAPPPNPMMGSGIGMGMGMGGGGMAGMGMGMGMGGYGGMNQQPAPAMGMPMGMNNMGGMPMGMNMMGQGAQMRPPPSGLPQGPTIPGYNPTMGSGGYPPQNPYGGYR
ncbi:Epsin domain [Macleaya cordata]|uniref:Epsin domain n=1 Tax=Macleaya cordata TaxID=56857 RepID=A0A200QLT7_MACCD|nr:Epsin domain [Macleaya cordata]